MNIHPQEEQLEKMDDLNQIISSCSQNQSLSGTKRRPKNYPPSEHQPNNFNPFDLIGFQF